MDSPDQLLILVGTGIGVMLFLALAFVIFFSFSQNKLRSEQIKSQQMELAHQQDLLYSNLVTQEAERKRIARDLHDEIGSKLNVIHLYLNQISYKSPDISREIEPLMEVLNNTIHTSRRISHDLLPPTLENFGLASAVEELCNHLESSATLKVSLEINNRGAGEIEKTTEVHLFRVLQELVSNTLKYASADHITIRLTQNQGILSLEYRDNGKGFDLSDDKNRKGLGMKNIESRLQMINGIYHLQTAIGEGLKFTLEVKIPSPGSISIERD
ncbi:MAG: sensor histidine kinase [Bacteroidia bacterium]